MTEKTKNKKVGLEAGDLIEHTTQDYGRGRVMEVKDGIATIAFKKTGKKYFPASSRYLIPVESAEPVDSPESVESPELADALLESGDDPAEPVLEETVKP